MRRIMRRVVEHRALGSQLGSVLSCGHIVEGATDWHQRRRCRACEYVRAKEARERLMYCDSEFYRRVRLSLGLSGAPAHRTEGGE